MKTKKLIEELQKCDPEADVQVAVYGCGGFDDSHQINNVDPREYDGSKWVQLEIDVSCGVHRKPFTTDCPPELSIKEQVAQLTKGIP